MADTTATSTIGGLSTKHVSLVILVIQNSALALSMRYSRILPGPQYLSSTAVVMSEIIKLVVSLFIHLYQQYTQPRDVALPLLSEYATSTSPPHSIKQLFSDIFSIKSGFLKLLVPAILYTLQNNLQFVAATNLDAATFQVTYQCKILATAFFAVVLLRQQLSMLKWLSLLILTLGVACVQIPTSSTKAIIQQGNWFVGISAVAVACLCSGFAGVYFEKVIKTSGSSPSASLWVRNLQMGTGCLAIALTGALVWDGKAIRENGFFQGYRSITVFTICCQASGGLIVAIVIKYADNILKGFATSLSIILSTVASIFLFAFVVTPYFIFGTILVLAATYMYGAEEEKSTEANGQKQNSENSETAPMISVEDYDEKSMPFTDEENNAISSRAASLDEKAEARQQRYERMKGHKVYDELGYVD